MQNIQPDAFNFQVSQDKGQGQTMNIFQIGLNIKHSGSKIALERLDFLFVRRTSCENDLVEIVFVCIYQTKPKQQRQKRNGLFNCLFYTLIQYTQVIND